MSKNKTASLPCGTCGHPESEHDEFGECQAVTGGEPCWGICGEGAR